MWKYELEYRIDKPETEGETDKHFDLDNYKDWMEEQLTECRRQFAIQRVSNRFDAKYKPPFRVGRKQCKAVLDATGREVIFFSDSEEQARKYCDYLNGY